MKQILPLLIFFSTLSVYAQDINNASQDYIHFYQEKLSSQKNSRCAMYPSCSEYGMQSFKTYHFFKAFTQTCDRLVRCSHDSQYYDITYKYGYRSYFDPLEYDSNDPLIHKRFPLPHTASLKRAPHRDDNQLFINRLINKEQYDLALLEIEKLIFHGYHNSFIHKQQLLCYRGLKQYENGIYAFETEFPDSVRNNTQVKEQASLLYYSCSNFDKSGDLAQQIVDETTSANQKDRASVLRGLNYIQQGQYDAAKECLTANMSNSLLLDKNINLIGQLENQKTKKPILAKVLSIIPGAGYLYTNHIGSAATSFLINSLLGYATYTSIKSKNYGVAGICGFLSVSFYLGNINGAGKSAKRYNQSKKNHTIREIETINNLFIN